ncbi:thioredoxin family protein [Pseudostreptobacillus hongkongensis]|uniref:thioredoxin family protein n=1 Tax=Pseudostreptobacillus hongkongensis TaxID=1162717 RepID=UPI000832BD2F|nr:thioredoxin family protein [Pseudostreptobacillus hongkongensis]
MATFKEYLKFTDKIEYRDRQIAAMRGVNIDEDIIEELSSIGEKKTFLVFAHPECPDCTRFVAVLETLAKYIPFVEIDYRLRSLEKELLLSLNPEGKIPSVFLVDGIKITKILSEYPDSIKKMIYSDVNIKNKYHLGEYDGVIIETILNAIREK